MATVPGIDVSYWDSAIDWSKVHATGQCFMFTKATEGDFYADPTFPTNWSGAKAVGILRGAYHFFRCNVDPKKQSKKFIDYVKTVNDNGELPMVLDLESNDGMSKDKVISYAKTWLDEVEKAFGRKPIIYSGQYFLQDYFTEANGLPPAWAKDYPLWLAQYPDQYTPGMSPSLPKGWSTWKFWQYSDKGQVDGINASVDMNVFNGTLEDLNKFAGTKASTQPPVSQPPKTHTIVSGDTFNSVANKYGVTVSDLANANPQLLKVGEKLNIPAVATTPPTPPPSSSTGSGSSSTIEYETYTVKQGDTLSVIAEKYGTTVDAIASLNGITDPSKIYVGQVLKIP